MVNLKWNFAVDITINKKNLLQNNYLNQLLYVYPAIDVNTFYDNIAQQSVSLAGNK